MREVVCGPFAWSGLFLVSPAEKKTPLSISVSGLPESSVSTIFPPHCLVPLGQWADYCPHKTDAHLHLRTCGGDMG